MTSSYRGHGEMEPTLGLGFYHGYARWKSWGINQTRSAQLSDAFRIECSRANTPRSAVILEMGFGNGEFLDWCRAAGHQVVGVEIMAEQVAVARERGHDAVLSDGVPPALADNHLFDVIAAFDVFEHLAPTDLITWLTWMGKHLNPDGRIVARFPNGGSPFGRYYQAGDLTHQSTLSGPSIEQAAMLTGLRMIAAYNAARPMAGVRLKLAKWLAYKARDVIELAIGYIYFARRVPLDPNLTVILGRRSV
jgi:2-polyprenyl-3-methyl-5-hydroxy-6-metoxy-1,4-benzoquinol methylase